MKNILQILFTVLLSIVLCGCEVEYGDEEVNISSDKKTISSAGGLVNMKADPGVRIVNVYVYSGSPSLSSAEFLKIGRKWSSEVEDHGNGNMTFIACNPNGTESVVTNCFKYRNCSILIPPNASGQGRTFVFSFHGGLCAYGEYRLFQKAR